MSKPSYEQLIAAVQGTDCSAGIPAELSHQMDDLLLPGHLQHQLQKLLRAGNPDRAVKLIIAYQAHEPFWTRIRRKLGF